MTEAETAYATLRAADSAGDLSVESRQQLLARLDQAIRDAREAVVAAIDADFGGRAREETLVAELLVTTNAIRHARPRLARWARAKRVPVGFPFWPARAWEVPQPLGVVGVISPWNYPFQLAVVPLIAALSAGNRVALKPSEATPRTSLLLKQLIAEALGAEVAQVVLGGTETAKALTRLPFDHLFFSGSSDVGRHVMAAAAQNLTPVTLELGGKCPALVLPDARLDETARAIVTGKGLNAGQTCIAPDTVLLVGVSREAFTAALEDAARRQYPEGLGTGLASERHKARLESLLTGESLEAIGFPGRATRPAQLALAPLRPGSAIAREEIFGPVFSVETVASIQDAIGWIRSRPAPLAIYLFTHDSEAERAVLAGTRAGALVVNGTVMHAAIEALPFGGVGASGFGRYHGRAGFDTFSNRRAYVRQSPYTLARLLDPPYTSRGRAVLEWLLR